MSAMRKAKAVALCAVMVTLALALSLAERLIPLPLPLPGVKLGLANVVTLVALALFKKRYGAMILLCRCLLGAIFGGGITGLLFSLCGGVLAFGAMALAMRGRKLSVYGVSVLGAAAHQIGQILAAMGLMGSMAVGAYLPWLLLTAVATGLLTGGLCAGVLKGLSAAGVRSPEGMEAAV